MSKTVTLTIDGQVVEVPLGTLVVDAAKRAGIDIPVFCYHPKMEPVGMCRMCLVDIGRPVIDRATGEPVRNPDGTPKIQFGPKLETACTLPVSEGMVVESASDKVQAARKEIVEFILTSHPLDCPVCDKGGECPLQNLTMDFGAGESRFLYDEKMQLDKHVPLGELIFLDRERCIQCGRCVRFQDEIAADPVIGFYHRGRALEIVTFSEPGFDSYFSGNTSDICPVGALTTADFRFGARPWEMIATASICPQCPVGCNLVYNVRREARSKGEIVIKRAMPRQNEAVNEIWMCDKGRFTYHYTESTQRLTQPLVRKDGELKPVSWDEALDLVAARIKEAEGKLFTVASGRLSNEDLFNLQQLSSHMLGKTALYTHMAGGDLVAQVGLGKGSNFSEMGAGSTIFVVASDLEEEAPIWWLRVKQAAERGAALIVANPRNTKLHRYARQSLRYAYGKEAATVQALTNIITQAAKTSTQRSVAPVQGKSQLPGLESKNGKGYTEAAQLIASAENLVIIYGSDGIGLEASQALAHACANLLIATNHVGRPNNGLLAVWPRANDQGAWDMGLRPVLDLRGAFTSSSAIYVVACDPAGDDPSLAQTLTEASSQGAFVVVQELFLTETARMADVVLPAQAYTEREGTYTSGERRVQRYYPAVLPRPDCKPDFEITGLVAKRLGMDWESLSPGRVMMQIAAKVPAYNELGVNPYRNLSEVQEQFPVVGRSDLYYGGTTYGNTQGLGIQLSPAAQRGEAFIPGSLREGSSTQEIGEAQEGLLAVPVTLLYDRGITTWSSQLLHQRIPQPYILLNPSDAQGHGIQTGEPALVTLDGAAFEVNVTLDASLPAGIVLVPRSLGLPIHQPVPIALREAVSVREGKNKRV